MPPNSAQPAREYEKDVVTGSGIRYSKPGLGEAEGYKDDAGYGQCGRPNPSALLGKLRGRKEEAGLWAEAQIAQVWRASSPPTINQRCPSIECDKPRTEMKANCHHKSRKVR